MLRSKSYDTLFFVAILATLLSLAPAMAHFFELPRKIFLPRDAYFTVQQIYSGWDLFAIILVVQLIALVMLAWRVRDEYYVFRPVLAALLLLIAAQILFWVFTFPANVATHNWTVAPPDWQSLRRNWEYSHAAAAICQFLGLTRLVGALFARIRMAGR